jgi:hypothetical protein
MTGLEKAGAVILFGIMMQLLKICGAIQILFIFPNCCHRVSVRVTGKRLFFVRAFAPSHRDTASWSLFLVVG